MFQDVLHLKLKPIFLKKVIKNSKIGNYRLYFVGLYWIAEVVGFGWCLHLGVFAVGLVAGLAAVAGFDRMADDLAHQRLMSQVLLSFFCPFYLPC